MFLRVKKHLQNPCRSRFFNRQHTLMKTPYEILEVAEHATDSEIKQAYLQKVKLYPPDRDHEKFQQIHSAYETIKNRTSRENYALFHFPEADFNALLDRAFSVAQAPVISAEHFEKLLRVSIDEKTFLTGNRIKTNQTLA